MFKSFFHKSWLEDCKTAWGVLTLVPCHAGQLQSSVAERITSTTNYRWVQNTIFLLSDTPAPQLPVHPNHSSKHWYLLEIWNQLPRAHHNCQSSSWDRSQLPKSWVSPSWLPEKTTFQEQWNCHTAEQGSGTEQIASLAAGPQCWSSLPGEIRGVKTSLRSQQSTQPASTRDFSQEQKKIQKYLYK